MSEVGSIIVRKIAENADVGLVAKSTEEVLNKFEEYNSRREDIPGLKKLIVASMDIEKWYPSNLSGKSAKIVRRMWEESDLLIDEIEYEELALYLGKILSKKEVIEEAFEDVIYTRIKQSKKRQTRKKIGRKFVKNKSKKNSKKRNTGVKDIVFNSSGGADTPITNLEVNKDRVFSLSRGADTSKTNLEVKNIEKENNSSKTKKIIWKKAKRAPTKEEKRKMFGKALEIMLVLCLDNHCYQFDNKVRVQAKGGPIGLKLTGEIADCIMIDWDKKFLAELRKLDLVPEIYTRFKDDVTIAIEALEKGSKIEIGEIVVNQAKKEVDEKKSDEKVTMEIIQGVANSIESMTQFTIETPCNFTDRKLPVLDVKVNVNQQEKNRIDFEYYEKPTKLPRVILADSALSFNQKRTILTQECLRILRNTKLELGPDIRKRHLDGFMLKLKNSGYNRKFRTEILDSALKAYDKMREPNQCTEVEPGFQMNEKIRRQKN